MVAPMATPIPPADVGSDPAHRQLQLDLGHEPSHDEADFVIGDGNRLAFLHLAGWPNWPGPLTLLVGPPKSGKSHLARIWAGRASADAPAPGEL